MLENIRASPGSPSSWFPIISLIEWQSIHDQSAQAWGYTPLVIIPGGTGVLISRLFTLKNDKNPVVLLKPWKLRGCTWYWTPRSVPAHLGFAGSWALSLSLLICKAGRVVSISQVFWGSAAKRTVSESMPGRSTSQESMVTPVALFLCHLALPPIVAGPLSANAKKMLWLLSQLLDTLLIESADSDKPVLFSFLTLSPF
jgi:hypothetical protein